MKAELRKSRLLMVVAYLAGVGVLSLTVFVYGFVQALGGLAGQGQADLALASDRVASQLQRYREMALVIVDHPDLIGLTERGDAAAAQALLEKVAAQTSALDVMFMDLDGFVQVAARQAEYRNLTHLDFAEQALNGELGAGMGTYFPLPHRAYYFAAPQFGPNGKVKGALVVAADIAEIEWDWSGSTPAAFFSDHNGIVRISNRAELAGWVQAKDDTGLKPPGDPGPSPFVARQLWTHEIWLSNLGADLPGRALHLVRDLPEFALRAETLVDTSPALRLALLQSAALAGLCLAFGALLFLATERRRTLAQANTELEGRVAARTQALSETNVALRREISERQEAEAALRLAQENLVQAGKLSALGQMSAGISHELNQPLMAIQSFAENGAAFLDLDRPEKAGENLGRISDLAARMGRIIRNLRAFARQESAPVTRVDLVDVLKSAVELTAARCRQADVNVHFVEPTEALYVQGGEVRLGQVFVNLIANAADAMVGSHRRELTISILRGQKTSVSFADTGPGIDVPDKVFEPFYSTKSVQEQGGMGLGLSISYGIVQSFGGDIRGENAAGGGAVFTVELEDWRAVVCEAAE